MMSFCAYAIILFLYTGLLVSVQVGFTFKASQFFAVLGLGMMLAQYLAGYRQSQTTTALFLPFLLFLLSVLPSFWNADLNRLLFAEKQTSIRLVFNFLLVWLIAVNVIQAAVTKKHLIQLLELSFLSCFLSLCFGYFQQAGYYFSFYDPTEYVGIHSTFVDVYGPFLRFSPGTFANEYGEILQTTGILLVGFLCLDRQWVGKRKRLMYSLLLGLVVLALLLNFTRAAWIVFSGGSLFLLLILRVRWYTFVSIGLFVGGLLAFLAYFTEAIATVNALHAIQQRLLELQDVTTYSAGARLEAWQMAWHDFFEHPFIGNGWGAYIQTHNVPLQLLAETGLLGFVCFYSLMGWVMLTMWQGCKLAKDPILKNLQISLLVAFLGCLAFDLTNHGILHFVFWFTIAMGLSVARFNKLSQGFPDYTRQG